MQILSHPRTHIAEIKLPGCWRHTRHDESCAGLDAAMFHVSRNGMSVQASKQVFLRMPPLWLALHVSNSRVMMYIAASAHAADGWGHLAICSFRAHALR